MDKKKFDRSNYKYIYDCNFANFLITHGAVCTGTGISESSGEIYWAFDYDSCQEAYALIGKRKKRKD